MTGQRCWRSDLRASHSFQRCADPEILNLLSLCILTKDTQLRPQRIMPHLIKDIPELIVDLLQCRSTVMKIITMDSDQRSECKLGKIDKCHIGMICQANLAG